MTSYIITFIVYTTAMIGVIFLSLFVYKHFSVTNNKISTSKFLEIEDCVSLGVRKQLYVVRAGNEKFLIASDTERTTFLSKLGSDEIKMNKSKDFVEVEVANLYGKNDFVGQKDASAILRNIISSGERKNG